jgi:uncharacterized protein (AIM24 family)
LQSRPAEIAMSRFTLDAFRQRSLQRDRHEGVFELETDRFLEIHLDGMVWTRKGSMVAYHGDIKFTREGMLEHGVGRALKKMFTSEGMQLTKAEGRGVLYVADRAKKITILELRNETVSFNGNDVLAFEPSLKWDIKLMRSMAGMMSGGLFNVRLEGSGLVAFTSHGDPLTLPVSSDRSTFTDPHATIAWSGNLTPEFKVDVTLKSFFGRGSGESFQMRFQGDGFVVIQPYEERGEARAKG